MTNIKFNIRVQGILEVVRQENSDLFNINASYFCFEAEDGTTIEFGGTPWQEGLTQEEIDNLNIGGYSVSELQAMAT